MKKLLTLLLITTPCYAGHITHNDYQSGATITASGQNANENAIVNEMNGNLDSTNLAANSVTNSQLAAASVTADKLSGVLQSSVTAMMVTNVDQTIISTKTFAGPVIISSGLKTNGSYGTSGQVLVTSGSASVPPVWANAGTVGGYILLGSTSANNNSSVDITISSGNYAAFLVVGDSVTFSNNAVTMEMQIRDTAGLNNSGYSDVMWIVTSGSSGGHQNSSLASWELSNPSAISNTENLSTVVTIPGAVLPTKTKRAFWSSTYKESTIELATGAGEVTTGATSLTGVHFFASAGNLNSGTFYLYGMLNQ